MPNSAVNQIVTIAELDVKEIQYHLPASGHNREFLLFLCPEEKGMIFMDKRV